MAAEKKYETLEQLADHRTNLEGIEKEIAEDEWNPGARIALGKLYYGIPQYYAETGPDVVKHDLYEGSADGKVPGLKKTTEKLTEKAEAELDKILQGLNKEKLLTYLITHPQLKPKTESESYKKIDIYRQLASAYFEGAIKGNIDAMRELLQFYGNSSAIYASGGRDETVKKTYAIAHKVVTEKLDKRKEEIKEEDLRAYIKESIKGLKPEEKSEALPDLAVLYRKKTI